MKHQHTAAAIIAGGLFSVLGALAFATQDKDTLKVPNGLAFAEFKGYETWQVVSISHNGDLMAATLANPEMIKAYQAGVPGNGKQFPDGARMAKIHWTLKKLETFPAAIVPDSQHDIDFMVKDSKRFGDSGGDTPNSSTTPHPVPSARVRHPTNPHRPTTLSVGSRVTPV